MQRALACAFNRLVEECILAIAGDGLGEETGLYAQINIMMDEEARSLVLDSPSTVTYVDEAEESHIGIGELVEVDSVQRLVKTHVFLGYRHDYTAIHVIILVVLAQNNILSLSHGHILAEEARIVHTERIGIFGIAIVNPVVRSITGLAPLVLVVLSLGAEAQTIPLAFLNLVDGSLVNSLGISLNGSNEFLTLLGGVGTSLIVCLGSGDITLQSILCAGVGPEARICASHNLVACVLVSSNGVAERSGIHIDLHECIINGLQSLIVCHVKGFHVIVLKFSQSVLQVLGHISHDLVLAGLRLEDMSGIDLELCEVHELAIATDGAIVVACSCAIEADKLVALCLEGIGNVGLTILACMVGSGNLCQQFAILLNEVEVILLIANDMPHINLVTAGGVTTGEGEESRSVCLGIGNLHLEVVVILGTKFAMPVRVPEVIGLAVPQVLDVLTFCAIRAGAGNRVLVRDKRQGLVIDLLDVAGNLQHTRSFVQHHLELILHDGFLVVIVADNLQSLILGHFFEPPFSSTTEAGFVIPGVRPTYQITSIAIAIAVTILMEVEVVISSLHIQTDVHKDSVLIMIGSHGIKCQQAVLVSLVGGHLALSAAGNLHEAALVEHVLHIVGGVCHSRNLPQSLNVFLGIVKVRSHPVAIDFTIVAVTSHVLVTSGIFHTATDAIVTAASWQILAQEGNLGGGDGIVGIDNAIAASLHVINTREVISL